MIEPIDKSQRQQVLERTEHFIASAEEVLERSFERIPVLFDLSGTTAGMFRAHGHKREIRYNPWIFAKYFDENPTLGRWCAKVRHWKSKGKDSLTESRMRRLTEAGFCWDAKKDPSFWKLQNTCEQAQDRWEEMFEKLLRYKKEFGNCLVPKECRGKHKVSQRWEKLLEVGVSLTRDIPFAAVAALVALGNKDSEGVSSKTAKRVSYSLG